MPSYLAESLYSTTVRETTNYRTDNYWVSQAGNSLYIDGQYVALLELNNLKGAIEDGTYLWIVGDNKLWILTKQGEIVEELSIFNGLPNLINKIGRNRDGALIVGGLNGDWLVDETAQDWQVYRRGSIVWTTPATDSELPMSMREVILVHANNHLISWERLLLDFHSGRLFGNIGVVIADIAALLLVFLSATGVFLWLRRA